MIDRETALRLAQKSFDESASAWPHMSFAAVDERHIIETSFAWILPWNDRRFLGGDTEHEIVGHSPRVVLKSDGTVMDLPVLTASERAAWKSNERWGTIEHRIANLAKKLGVMSEELSGCRDGHESQD